MDTANLEQIKSVSNLANSIIAKQAELEALLGRWRKLFPNTSPLDQSPGEPLPDPQPIGSLEEMIVAHLEQHPDKEFNVATLMQELKVPSVSIGTQLSKLTIQGRIIRSGRGLYKAKSENAAHNLSIFVRQEEEPTEVGS
jgi:predicted Rossmann fold nucleotide-binding protein DprA/Smf involved in DNA uptake